GYRSADPCPERLDLLADTRLGFILIGLVVRKFLRLDLYILKHIVFDLVEKVKYLCSCYGAEFPREELLDEGFQVKGTFEGSLGVEIVQPVHRMPPPTMSLSLTNVDICRKGL